MSERQLPVKINALRLTEQHARLTGALAIDEMPRLLPMLGNAIGRVAIDLAFDVDSEGLPVIKGQVDATLNLICQRCLQLVEYVIDDECLLSPITKLEQADQLPEAYEPVLIEGEEQLLAALVEDELILRLPIVAMHEPEECGIKVPKAELPELKTVRKNPFDALKKLKKEE